MSNHSLIYDKSGQLKKILAFGAVIAGLIGASFLYPPLFLIPLALVLVGIVNFNISYLQKLRSRKIWQILFSIAMAGGAAFPASTPASAFSYLFQTSETVLNTCVLSAFPTVATISQVLFGGLRIAFMVGVAIAGYQIWQRRQSGQDFQDVLNILISSILIVVVLGFVEPLIVGTGAC